MRIYVYMEKKKEVKKEKIKRRYIIYANICIYEKREREDI